MHAFDLYLTGCLNIHTIKMGVPPNHTNYVTNGLINFHMAIHTTMTIGIRFVSIELYRGFDSIYVMNGVVHRVESTPAPNLMVVRDIGWFLQNPSHIN